MQQTPPPFGSYGPQQAQSNLNNDVNNLAPLSDSSSWRTSQTGISIPYTPPRTGGSHLLAGAGGVLLLVIIVLVLRRVLSGRAVKTA